MKLKKFLAALMAACMLVSTPIMALGTENTEVVESTEGLTNREIAIQNEDGKIFVEATEETETTEVEHGVWDTVEVVETETETETERENELANSDVTLSGELQTEGITAPDDAMVLEDKKEVSTEVETGKLTEMGAYSVEEVDRDEVDVDLANNAAVKADFLNEETVTDTDMVRVIILMEDKSIIEKDSDAKMNWLTKIQIALMESKQNKVVSKIEKKALDGEEIEIRYQYTWLLNGIATEVPYGAIDEIEAVDGVKDVLLQMVYETCDTDASPYTVADGVMIGRDATWADGYTGKGIVISIIDTGIDDDHQNFAALDDDKLTKDSATKSTVSSVLSELNASQLYSGLTAEDVYRSTKIAYGFNYVDENLRINHDADSQGDHGTHVAGIAAANDLGNGEAVGVAPDAQLYVMKVFGANGGAYSDDLLAAVEDSLILGTDVINMSLGSPAGFTSDGEMFDEIYGRVDDTNTILAIAAGNSTTSGVGNLWGTDTNLTSNPDNSIVSSPATYVNATSVASVENIGVKGYYMEAAGKKLSYIDGSGYNEPLLSLANEEYDYAMVPNYGQSLEDFVNAGVEGKIAVVQRGVTAFSEKQQLAQDAGAIACIVYNNVSGTINMDLSSGTATIPCASITMQDGEFLAYAKEANADELIYVSASKAILESDTAYQMSDFSSWGVSPNLKMEPDVTAPGGNIYSTLDGGEYGLMSGTSMASPNMAGVAALVMQYAKENYPEMSASQLHTFVNTLIVSTAEPLAYNDELDYSPRNQGAGLVNAYNAVKTNAYLTVDGVDVPKAELGDDVAKTGSFTYDFNVVNFGDTTLYYDLATSSQTEGVLYDEETGKSFMSTTPVALAANASEASANMIVKYDYNEDEVTDTRDARQLYLTLKKDKALDETQTFRYDLNGSDAVEMDDVQAYLDALVGKEVENVNLAAQTLAVAAGETANVTVTVNVTDEGKAYMDTNFENGIYVEGFTKLTALNEGGVDLSLPYLGFYGDWTQAPMIDSGYYWESGEDLEASQYYNVISSNYGNSTDYSWYPGLNPYLSEEFDLNNVSVSPNNDGYLDYFQDIYVSLLRNAATLSFTYTDANTGEVYFEDVIGNVAKSYYYTAYGMVVPYVYSWYSPEYLFTDAEGNVLPHGTELIFTVKAEVDYDAHESNNVSDEWVMPITVDLKAPELVDSVSYKDEETGRYFMRITVKDDVAVAAVNILNKAGTALLAQEPVDKVAHGEAVTMTYDVTGYGEDLMVILGDYAFNESAYALEVDGNEPEVDESLLYGYRVYDANYYDDTLYGWIGIDHTTADIAVCSSEYYMDYALVSAAYVGGHIIAVDANDDLVAIKPGYWDERTKITSLGTTVSQLAFDPTTNTLYGFDKDNAALVTIDIVTGELTTVSTGYFSNVNAMACTDEGVLYGINGSGYLCLINKETGAWGDKVLATGLRPYYAQSMTYDKDTNSLFWAFYSYSGDVGTLQQIDLTANTVTKIGTIGGKAEVVGLLTLDETGFKLPEVELESISVDKEVVTLLVGNKQMVNVLKTPWYADAEDYVWTSEDETVATVDASGTITAMEAGTTTIHVKTEDGLYSAKCKVNVVAPKSDLYAFSMGGNTTYNQWISFNAGSASDMTILSEGDYVAFYAGEYVDGYVYTYSSAGEFYKVDTTTFEKTKLSNDVCEGNSYIGDMSFDYSTGFLYGFHMDEEGDTNLVIIDTLTGNFETVAEALEDEYGYPMISFAIDTDGTMYMLSYEGLLYTYDVESGALTKVGYTGYSASYMTQCMAIDHNTGELYWTMIGSSSALMYVDKVTGTALSLGQIDGSAQVVAMYAVPETVPTRPEVAVESFTADVENVKLLEKATVAIPVSVKPYNATDRTITWTVADETVAAVENGMLVGKKAGTTTITGTVGEFTVTINVEVLASAGALTGYVITDLSTGSGQFWGDFYDYDLSSGVGLANGDTYMMYAGEYYDGKIYGYGPNYDTWDYSFFVINRETFEIEKEVVCASDAPDVVEMAFDYSTGTMYAVAGTQNVMNSNSLYMVDTKDGSFYKVASFDTQMMTLACTEAGEMYGVDINGYLYQIDKTTGELTEIGYTGYGANQYQSMAYDYDTGNMYWAQVYNDALTWTTTTALLVVNVDDASTMNLGTIGTMGCMVSGLHIVPDEKVEVQTPEITGILLDKTSELLGVGGSFKLTAQVAPISVVDVAAEIAYTSDNTAVATVAEDGTVTAVGAGKAVITATCGDVSATCTVDVVGDETELYVVNPNGWETSPLLTPKTIATESTLPTEAGLTIAKACYNQDGYFYAVDEDGYLWKYTEDMVQIEKIGDLLGQLDNAADYTSEEVKLVDLEANAFTGKVYAVVGFIGYWSEEYYIYEVDLTTAAATSVHFISWSVGRPLDIAFMGETEVAIYDSLYDYVYKSDISEMYADTTQMAFVQFTVASGDHFSMTYSKEFNQLFIATDDYYVNNGMALFKLNTENGIISKVSDAAYNGKLVSIILIEGTTPVAGVAPEVEDETEVDSETEVESETENDATTEADIEVEADATTEADVEVEADVTTETAEEVAALPEEVETEFADLENNVEE